MIAIVRRAAALVALCLGAGLTAHAAYADAAWSPAPTRADSLIRRITASWGPAPVGGWCVEWLLARGDTSAFDPASAEIVGNDRIGLYTLAFRPRPYAAPALVLRVRIGSERARVVAARALPRGAQLTEDDVLQEHSIMWGLPADTGVVLPALLGTVTRRALRAGEAIRPGDLSPVPVVTPGDSVRAELTRDGVTLSLQATALRAAPLGARIPVRLAHGRQLTGTVVAPRVVKLH